MIDKRMMYAQGQRVAKSLDGSRPGYRGSSYGSPSRSSSSGPAGGASSGGNYGGNRQSGSNFGSGTNTPSGSNSSSSGNGDNNRENYRTSTEYITSATPEAIKKNARAFEVGVDPANDPLKFKGTNVIGPFGFKQDPYSKFRNFRPEMPKIPLGLGSLVMNMINPGGKGPLQAFSDFSANKNRNYFMDEVVRAGKYTLPDGRKLDYGNVSDMTGTELEAAYKNYLSSRGSGSIDAYGNPIGGQDNSGITSIYDARPYQMTQNVEVEDPVQNLFASRFLQNQPDEVRETIEANMPIRFPNLFT
jgi:hypothetical protein